MVESTRLPAGGGPGTENKIVTIAVVLAMACLAYVILKNHKSKSRSI